MLTNNDSVSFVATLDKTASRTFYEESLGLKLIADESFALVFYLNGQILQIAKVAWLKDTDGNILSITQLESSSAA